MKTKLCATGRAIQARWPFYWTERADHAGHFLAPLGEHVEGCPDCEIPPGARLTHRAVVPALRDTAMMRCQWGSGDER